MNTKSDFIEHLKKTRVLKTEQIKNAFEKIDRKDFVDPDYAEEAYEDYPLPISYGQTISQPTTVAFMLELLDLKGDEKVLDVGSGSGYTTALLAEILNVGGEVLGIELIPELAEKGKRNLNRYNFKNARIEHGDGRKFDKDEMFDRILVNAASDDIPANFTKLLKPGGIVVIPVRHSIVKIEKNSNGDLSGREFPGFSFVPLK
jgi:protein-L-isoaspartate(D-aspartate) O-methyltransferase